MKYPRLYTNDIITIDGVAYMVMIGLTEPPRNNKIVYNVELRSVVFNPNKFKEYYRCKNISLPPFEKIK